MKKSDLRRIIKEEITKLLNEEPHDFVRDLRAAGVNPNNKSDVEKYLGRKLDDSEYNELLGKDDEEITIVGRKNGRPIYFNRRTNRSWVGESNIGDLHENRKVDLKTCYWHDFLHNAITIKYLDVVRRLAGKR